MADMRDKAQGANPQAGGVRIPAMTTIRSGA
jgi:hypothetical protein